MITMQIMLAAQLGSAGKTVILAACKLHTTTVSIFSVRWQTTAQMLLKSTEG
jgi:hypothetical protein